MESNWLLFIYIVGAIVLTHIPYLGKYFAVVNTAVHEGSHAVIAILTSGKVYAIKLFPDSSGLATTGMRGRLPSILVAYAGYTGSSLTAVLLYWCLKQEYYQGIIVGFIILLVSTLIIWMGNLGPALKITLKSLIRFKKPPKDSWNFYGFVWLVTFSVLLGLAYWYGDISLIQHISMFLSSIVLVQSVTTAYTILLLSFKYRFDAGDATNLKKFTHIPTAIWGMIFFLQSLYAVYYIWDNNLF